MPDLEELQKNQGIYKQVKKNGQEKMKMQEVKTKIIDDTIKFGKGDVLIPLNQKKSNLIVELMEPEAPNSFVSFGIMKTKKEDILTN